MAEKEVDLDALADAEESFRPSWASMESAPIAVAEAPPAPAPAAEAAPIVPTAVISIGAPTAEPAPAVFSRRPRPASRRPRLAPRLRP
jgi:hypothetical protein